MITQINYFVSFFIKIKFDAQTTLVVKLIHSEELI